jgi:hypothetical protein
MASGGHGLPKVLPRPYDRVRGGPPAGWAACGRLLPLWIPHAVRLWEEGLSELSESFFFRFRYEKNSGIPKVIKDIKTIGLE